MGIYIHTFRHVIYLYTHTYFNAYMSISLDIGWYRCRCRYRYRCIIDIKYEYRYCSHKKIGLTHLPMMNKSAGLKQCRHHNLYIYIFIDAYIYIYTHIYTLNPWIVPHKPLLFSKPSQLHYTFPPSQDRWWSLKWSCRWKPGCFWLSWRGTWHIFKEGIDHELTVIARI